MLTTEPFLTIFSQTAGVCFLWAGVMFAARWLRRSLDDSTGRGLDES